MIEKSLVCLLDKALFDLNPDYVLEIRYEILKCNKSAT